jgi:hypothetical protein
MVYDTGIDLDTNAVVYLLVKSIAEDLPIGIRVSRAISPPGSSRIVHWSTDGPDRSENTWSCSESKAKPNKSRATALASF